MKGLETSKLVSFSDTLYQGLHEQVEGVSNYSLTGAVRFGTK